MKSSKKFLSTWAGLLTAAVLAGECQAQSATLQPRQAFWQYQSPYYGVLVGYQLGTYNSVQVVQTNLRNVFRVTQIASQSNSAGVFQVGHYNRSDINQFIFGDLAFTSATP
jgi:hypothetical protein